MKWFGIFFFCGHLVFAQYDFEKIDQSISKNYKSWDKDLVVLLYKDNKIVYQKQSGNFTKDTPKPIASASKWLTAALIMTFVDEGKLSLDDAVSKYIPEFNVEGKNKITLRDCMSHQTGIHQEPLSLFKLLKQKKYQSLQDEVKDIALHTPLEYQPGTQFFYGNVGLDIAARVVEIISKQDFNVLMHERIFDVLDMKQSYFQTKNPNPSGGAVSTANDYMNFLTMLLHKGMYKGKKILTENAVSKLEEQQTYAKPIKYAPKVAEGYTYALGNWIQEVDSSGKPITFACPGLFGSWPLIDTKRNYACLFFVKNLLTESRTNAYLEIKKTIDSVFDTKN